MGGVSLSKRLETVISMVSSGNRVCDVGCDHGYVCIALVQRGISPFALAMDVNKGPLERAKEHIEFFGLSAEINIRLSDGLKEYMPGEADSLIIAGMGGRLMVNILCENINNTRDFKELILSPQSEIPEVRMFLSEQGFMIVDEAMVLEDGQYYTVIKARLADLADKQCCLSIAELSYGPVLIRKKDSVLSQFLHWKLGKHNDVLCKLKMLERNESRDNRIGELSKEVDIIIDTLKLIES